MDFDVSIYWYLFCLAFSCVSSTKQTLERYSNTLKHVAIYLVEIEGMFLRTSSVEAAHIYGVYVILVLGAW